jgi:hypothetical protein
MRTTRILILAACAALALGACTPKEPLTRQQVKSMVGLSMGDVNAKLGRASSITNAGDSIWWEYIGIATTNGANDAACHIIFKDGVAKEVRC